MLFRSTKHDKKRKTKTKLKQKKQKMKETEATRQSETLLFLFYFLFSFTRISHVVSRAWDHFSKNGRQIFPLASMRSSVQLPTLFRGHASATCTHVSPTSSHPCPEHPLPLLHCITSVTPPSALSPQACASVPDTTSEMN